MKPSAGTLKISSQAHHLCDMHQRAIAGVHLDPNVENWSRLCAAREALYTYISSLEEQVGGIPQDTQLRF